MFKVPVSWQKPLMLGLLFVVVSAPATYNLVDSLAGKLARVVVPGSAHLFKVAESGCPTLYGIGVHAVVFVLAVKHLCNV
jgi:hypothetical protein